PRRDEVGTDGRRPRPRARGRQRPPVVRQRHPPLPGPRPRPAGGHGGGPSARASLPPHGARHRPAQVDRPHRAPGPRGDAGHARGLTGGPPDPAPGPGAGPVAQTFRKRLSAQPDPAAPITTPSMSTTPTVIHSSLEVATKPSMIAR